MRLVVISIPSLLVLGCSGSSGVAAEQPAPPASPPAAAAADPVAAPADPAEPAESSAAPAGRAPGPPAGHGADELHRLEGATEAAVLAEFGEPATRRSFKMKDCCNEFEVELNNTYPPRKKHDDVEIHEWTWRYEGYSLTLWLHDAGKGWEVLETSRYSDDVEF